MEYLHLFVYCLNIICGLQIVTNLGKKLIFNDFISFSAITLWLTIPLIIFDLNYDRFAIPNLFGSEILAISKQQYYQWALPGTLAMILGLSLNDVPERDVKLLFSRIRQYLFSLNPSTAINMFLVGAISMVLGPYLPGGAKFVFFLLSQTMYIAVLYCLFGNFKFNKMVYWGATLISLKNVASGGMFGELIWWGLIISIFALIKLQWSFLKKCILLVLGVLAINVIQVAKHEYRRLTWNAGSGKNPSIPLLIKTIYKSSFTVKKANSNAGAYLLMYRLNHAYTVSRIMKHVPKNEPFARGETVSGALVASFIPRFLWPSKPKSGGHENMKRFANFDPHKGTSYDIGQIGDAWANFGYWGGIAFLFGYGLFISSIFKIIFRFALNKTPSLILWIPIVFLQLLKVEVSVVTNFNAAIKGLLFVMMVFFAVKQLRVSV